MLIPNPQYVEHQDRPIAITTTSFPTDRPAAKRCLAYPTTLLCSAQPDNEKPPLPAGNIPIDADHKLTYVYGIRGRKKLVIGAHSFYRFSSAKLNQTWYCSQRKPQRCRASLKLYAAGTYRIVSAVHTHGPEQFLMPMYETADVANVYYDEGQELRLMVEPAQRHDGQSAAAMDSVLLSDDAADPLHEEVVLLPAALAKAACDGSSNEDEAILG